MTRRSYSLWRRDEEIRRLVAQLVDCEERERQLRLRCSALVSLLAQTTPTSTNLPAANDAAPGSKPRGRFLRWLKRTPTTDR